MRILIIEDDEALAGLLSQFLSPIAREKPIIASNMTDAMKVIDDVAPIDLVTLDLSLPDSTREQSLSRIKDIKDRKPDCLIVVVTGAMKPDQEEEALKYGADGFMQKLQACRDEETFLGTLRDIGRSIVRNPLRYQKNLPLLEKLTEKICEHVACKIEKPT